MTLAASAPAAPRPLGALPLPTPAEVLDLQSVRAYPAVSVLVSTRPAARMSRQDAARLGGLVDLALARVAAECRRDVAAAVAEQLETLAVSACERPTRAAVALYAAPGRPGGGWSLPVPVVDRAVVDPTFATRDLVRALHRTPSRTPGDHRHDAHGGRLHPAVTQHRQARGGRPGCARPHLDRPARRPRAPRAGGVPALAPGRGAGPARPADRRGPRSHRDAGGVARGAPRAARDAGVDETFFYPARLSDDGDLVLPAPDVDHPEVVDDAVDEVIELVLGRGGWVALVDQGRLDHADRIALTLRQG